MESILFIYALGILGLFIIVIRIIHYKLKLRKQERRIKKLERPFQKIEWNVLGEIQFISIIDKNGNSQAFSAKRKDKTKFKLAYFDSLFQEAYRTLT